MEKRYNSIIAEQEIKDFWNKEKIYFYQPDPNKQTFSIDTPPPTISGKLHVGHLFSYTHADIIARFSRMKGFQVFYPFGFDDNGLPTERYVEKERKVSPFGIGRSEFIKICLEETSKAEKLFKELWQSIGLSVDWSKWYSTISRKVRKISQESFILLYKNGFIYRKQEPALYCTTCQTSVAQAELDDKIVDTTFNEIVFSTTDGNDIVINTTRPELLPSCVALFYHPDDKRYKKLEGKKAIVPLYKYEVPILTDDKVDPEKGSGLVMCCTFGDKTDIYWFKKHQLPYRESVGRNGRWTSLTGFLEGLKTQEARKTTIEKLKETGLLVNQKQISHPVNVHERCKKEIEYIILSQWFLNILDHKKDFLDGGEKINWYPKYMKSRYINWVENLSWDWCLSRQRFYGIPFPVWYCQKCDGVLLAPIDKLPVDPQENSYPGPCPHCKSKEITPDTDIMDTWNTSSLTPYICYSLLDKDANVFDESAIKSFLPMSMRPQAHDIIRTWAFYTIVKSWFHNKTLPWQSIMISGHVLTSGSEKISKSKKHAIPQPEKLIEQWSADAIRFWTASATLGTDVTFSESQLKIGQRLVTKLWNAFRFTHEHLQNFEPAQSPLSVQHDQSSSAVRPEPAPSVRPEPVEGYEQKNLGSVNEWILHQASLTFKKYEKELNKKEFSLALNHLEHFFWHNFCDNYLELIKNQLFNPDQYSPETVQATQWTLYWVGLRILQLYAPFVPFITETLYQKLYRSYIKVASIHQTPFKLAQISYKFDQNAHEIDQLLEIIAQVRKLKTEYKLSLGTPLKKLAIFTENKKLKEILETNLPILKGITRSDSIIFIDKDKGTTIEQEGKLYKMAICL